MFDCRVMPIVACQYFRSLKVRMSPMSGPEVPCSTSPRARSSQALVLAVSVLSWIRITQNDQMIFILQVGRRRFMV